MCVISLRWTTPDRCWVPTGRSGGERTRTEPAAAPDTAFDGTSGDPLPLLPNQVVCQQSVHQHERRLHSIKCYCALARIPHACVYFQLGCMQLL